MENKYYKVYIINSQYSDYYEDDKFVTNNKELAQKWVNKFNSIVENNTKRLRGYVNSDKYHNSDKYLLWSEYLGYSTPIANYSEIKFRKE